MGGHEEIAEQFQQLYELAPAAYMVTDPELVIQRANSATIRLLRRPLDQILGKPLLHFISADERAVFRSMVADALTALKQLVQPVKLEPVHGEPVEVLFSAAPIRDRQDKVKSIYWLFIEGFDQPRDELL